MPADEPWRIDVDRELRPLKHFQRATVDNAFARLYGDDDPVDSFLVADEVGLGKTLIARGVIARAIDHLMNDLHRPQVRVLYICSNAQIARQNLPKLSMGPEGLVDVQGAARLTLMDTATLLPGAARPLTFTAFTPGTSTNFGERMGQVQERARLYLMLRWAGLIDEGDPGAESAWKEFLRGRSSREGFDEALSLPDTTERWEGERRWAEERLAGELMRVLQDGPKGDRDLTVGSLSEIAQEFWGRSRDGIDADPWTRAADAILQLRKDLAMLVAQSFRPDLVVLDEFQRFKDLLPDPTADAPVDEDATFGRQLVATMLERADEDRPRQGAARAKMLLLSATPYRMYTQATDGQGDDHYSDFIATVRALADDNVGGDSRHPHADIVERGLAEIRHAMRAKEPARAANARDRVQAELRRVMSRTERLASTPHRDGMLTTAGLDAGPLTSSDVADYLALRRLSRAVGSYDPLELWRSAPYTLEMMDGSGYELAQKVQRFVAPAEAEGSGGGESVEGRTRGRSALVAALAERGHVVPPPIGSDGEDSDDDAVVLHAANPKMRALLADALGDGAESSQRVESWRMLWVAPAMPRHVLSGPYRGAERFTKELVFSKWSVAPRAISIVASNRAQALATEAARRVRGAGWRPLREPLRPTYSEDRGVYGRLWAWGMVYPSTVLASAGDVACYATRTGYVLPVETSAQIDEVAARLEAPLEELDRRWGGAREMEADARWYGVAGVLLDRIQAEKSGQGEAWVGPSGLGLVDALTRSFRSGREVAPAGIRAHLEALDELARHGHSGEDSAQPGIRLGTQPKDLARFLAAQAVGAPGVCALRALAGIFAGSDSGGWKRALHSTEMRAGAMRIGWAMLTLVDRPEIQAAVWAGTELGRSTGAAPDEDEAGAWQYLRAVLGQCLDGDLDAVLPEYLHQLAEGVILFADASTGTEQTLRSVVDEVVSAMSIVTTNPKVETLSASVEGRVVAARRSMSCRFALRYGDESSDISGENRAEDVRTAFNSPFWPFVLATTSAGQEGIDFHRYCHRVVHWNLPSNPVDLEQREGRVHRYKCHAVRKNVAATWGKDPRVQRSRDPWGTLFEVATVQAAGSSQLDAPGGADEMKPLWVWTGEHELDGDDDASSAGIARIERRVLALPFSREVGQYRRLVAMLGRYRLAFGQARQEELLAILGDAANDVGLWDSAMIDLAPRA